LGPAVDGTCEGTTSQNTSFSFSGVSIERFGGKLHTDTDARNVAFLTSIFDATFTLDQEYLFSSIVDMVATSGGADDYYRYQLSEVFFEQGFIFNVLSKTLHFENSGVLGPGQYRFELVS